MANKFAIKPKKLSMNNTLIRSNIIPAIWLIPALIFGVMLYRLRLGVDFTDESFYVAMAYNFYHGSQPFVDEINLVQISAWIVTPLIYLYGEFAPNFDGLILFMRDCYWLFLLLIAVVVYRSLDNIVNDRRLAVLMALTCASFVPFNIFALSYNTLGMGCFALGAFLLARGWLCKPTAIRSVLAGVAHAVAGLSYPSIVMPLILIYPLLFWYYKKDWKQIFFYGGAASVVVLGVLMPMTYAAGWDRVAYSFSYTRSFGYQNLSNMTGLFSGFIRHGYVVLLWGALFIWLRDKSVISAKLLIIFFPLIWLLVGGAGMPHANWYVVNYGMAAPLVFLLIRNKGVLPEKLLIYIWLPALLVGLNCAWSSGNAAIAAANGLIVGCAVTSWMLASLYKQVDRANISEVDKQYGYLYAPLIFVVVLVCFQFSSVYRDAPVSQLNHKAVDGPYGGIITTQDKVNFAEQISQDIASVSTNVSNGGLLALNDFPAAYLFSKLPAATNTAWFFSSDVPRNNTAREDLVKRFQVQHDYPSIIIKLIMMPYDANGWRSYRGEPNDKLNALASSSMYKPTVLRNEYEIYVLNPTKIEQLK